LKFVEKNWILALLSPRSRDNLPNPIVAPDNPYVPTNGPAIGDLMTVFDFGDKRSSPPLIIPGGI
jgi:phospholipase C